jgi:hypothetical protein
MRPVLTLVFVAIAVAHVEARQSPPNATDSSISPADYRHEISVAREFPVFTRGLKTGVKSTYNVTSIFGLEGEVAGSTAQRRLLAVVNARFIGPPVGPDRMRWFGIAGVAAGVGYREDRWWPMAGFGFQSEWIEKFALRAEMQLFSYDNRHVTDGRFSVGFVVGWHPRRQAPLRR